VVFAQMEGARAALGEGGVVAEASRARNLMELLADEALRPATAPEAVVEQFRGLRRRLRQAERRLQHEEAQRGSPQLAAAQQQAAGLREEHQRLVADIRARYDGEFDPDRPVPPIRFADALDLLPDDVPTAVVQYTLTVDRGLALVLTRDDVQAVPLPDLSDRQAFELARAWYASYYGRRGAGEGGDTASSDKGRPWAEEVPGLLAPVAERALWPVLRALEGRGVCRLVLSPSRALHVYPLHACRLADGRYLADACEVIYTPSLSILHRCASRRRTQRDRLFLVENPTVDLPFTEVEGAGLRQRFSDAAWLYGGEAIRERLLRDSGDCHVLHYTGHASFDPRDPLNSALILRNAKDRGQWLTLRDIFTGLHLRENLLTVLSGCESGMLLPDRVDEYVGLPSGFLYAGAACVLSTLWAVYDLSSALLMDRFYQEWQAGKSIAAALRAAQRWLRDGITSGVQLRDEILPELLAGLDDEHLRRECRRRAEYYAGRFPASPPFASPAHWAPFIATGLAYPLPPGAVKGIP
jgi:CHAT domain-containing protein